MLLLQGKEGDKVYGACGHSMGKERSAYGIEVKAGVVRKRPFGRPRYRRV
jgi:hypothetical protein